MKGEERNRRHRRIFRRNEESEVRRNDIVIVFSI